MSTWKKNIIINISVFKGVIIPLHLDKHVKKYCKYIITLVVKVSVAGRYYDEACNYFIKNLSG